MRHLLGTVCMLGVAACSSSASGGRVLVAVTVDWEGAHLEGVPALDELRTALGPAPLTHFVSAAYFTKSVSDPSILATVQRSVRAGDELGMHLHAWRSLAKASEVTPRLEPSFVTGTAELADVNEDMGFETDLDTYEVADLRALLRTSRRLLAKVEHPLSRSFRAGGYLGTPKVLQAARDEGYEVDSSALDARQLDDGESPFLFQRATELWPEVSSVTQPWFVELRGGGVLEVPIAVLIEHHSAAEIAELLAAAAARARHDPTSNVVVVLALVQETAAEHVGRVRDALATVRSKPEVRDVLELTTIEQAAARVGSARR